MNEIEYGFGLQGMNDRISILQAIDKCEDLQPDVVLMDVRMPELDGVLATQHIKKRWPHVKVLQMHP